MIKFRVAALCGAVFCLAAAWETAKLSGGPWRSPLSFITFVTGVTVSFPLLLLALAPESTCRQLLRYGGSWRDSLQNTKIPPGRWVGRLLMVLGLTTYVFLVLIYLPRQIPPEGNDQESYLILAGEIRDRGGPIGCLRDLFQGRFAEANRHPLYPMLLSYCPTYEGGKRLSALLGGITLVVLTVLIGRKMGELTGGLFCVLLATNGAFLYVSTLVACETLVVLCAGVAWLCFVPKRKVGDAGAHSALQAPGQNESSRSKMALPIFAALLGALYGTMYLVKAHAILLIVGCAIWLIAHYGWRIRQWKVLSTAVLMFLIGFSVMASPLLVRNVVRYGQPLFNVNGHLLFEDHYVDPVELAQRKTIREAAADYWRSHSLGQCIAREVQGLAWETFIIVRSLGPAPGDDGRVIFGFLLVVAGMVAVGVEPRSDRGLVAVWGLILLFFFAWYVPIAAGERFILPILTPALAYGASGMIRLTAYWFATTTLAGFTFWLIAGSIFWCTTTVILTYALLEL